MKRTGGIDITEQTQKDVCVAVLVHHKDGAITITLSLCFTKHL